MPGQTSRPLMSSPASHGNDASVAVMKRVGFIQVASFETTPAITSACPDIALRGRTAVMGLCHKQPEIGRGLPTDRLTTLKVPLTGSLIGAVR